MNYKKTYIKPETDTQNFYTDAIMLPASMVIDPGTGVDDEAAKDRENIWGETEGNNLLW